MKLAPLKLLSVLREVRAGSGGDRPLVIGGARELVPLLAKELRAGGDSGAVQEHGDAEHAAAVVWIGNAEGDALRAAARAGVPIVGVTEGASLAYVLDTDLVQVKPGQGFPVDEIARVLARRLGVLGAGLAARLPVLTLNQVRLVLRIALAYGHEPDSMPLPEVLGVVGAAFGFRAVARELLDLVPVAGWAAKGAVAYAGTKAIGEAARRRFVTGTAGST